MKRTHQKRLAKLAIALLEHWDRTHGQLVVGKQKLSFDMTLYLDAPNGGHPETYECGTSCCFLGFAPFVFPSTREKTWTGVSNFVLGGEQYNDEWVFLFDPDWPHDPVQAAKRALWLLRRGLPQDFIRQESTYYKSMSRANLITNLITNLKSFLA